MQSKSRCVALLPILVISASGFAFGCASGRFNHFSLVTDGAPSAELVLLRRSELVLAAFALTLELNRAKLVKLRTGTYAEFRLAPGTYQLHFGGFEAVPPATLNDLELAAGTRTYVMFGQHDLAREGSVLFWGPTLEFNVMTEEHAREFMRSYKRVGAE